MHNFCLVFNKMKLQRELIKVTDMNQATSDFVLNLIIFRYEQEKLFFPFIDQREPREMA